MTIKTTIPKVSVHDVDDNPLFSDSGTAHIAVSADDLGEAIGLDVQCPRCGETHPLEYGTSRHLQKNGEWSSPEPSKNLAFYKCGENVYLAGVGGKYLKGLGEGSVNRD